MQPIKANSLLADAVVVTALVGFCPSKHRLPHSCGAAFPNVLASCLKLAAADRIHHSLKEIKKQRAWEKKKCPPKKESQKKKISGPAEIRTRVIGFKVRCTNHYTTGPLGGMVKLWHLNPKSHVKCWFSLLLPLHPPPLFILLLSLHPPPLFLPFSLLSSPSLLSFDFL